MGNEMSYKCFTQIKKSTDKHFHNTTISVHMSMSVLMSVLDQYVSRPTGKPTICIGENKGADQLRGNREADQRLCFRYSDSTMPPT